MGFRVGLWVGRPAEATATGPGHRKRVLKGRGPGRSVSPAQGANSARTAAGVPGADPCLAQQEGTDQRIFDKHKTADPVR